jgi:hypothetical protein
MMRRLLTISVAGAIVGGLIMVGTHQKQETAYGAPPAGQVATGTAPIFVGQPITTVGENGTFTIETRDDEKDDEKEDSDVVAPFGINVLQMQDQAEAFQEQAEAMKDQAESLKELGGMKFLIGGHSSRSAYAKARAKVAKIQRELRDAEDNKKPELTKQLETAVSECFDQDMKVREGELTKIEQRLAKLRARVDKRKKARTDIIQLEMKVLENEADGLGFAPISGSDHYSYGYGFSAGMGEGSDNTPLAKKLKRHVVVRQRGKRGKGTPATTPTPPTPPTPPGAPAVPAVPPVKATSL